ncbi:MAG: PilZ domain-containing protein [Pseudomonadota bacterium]|nr:PilZ domain-containing protein [Pseudomonadota bacterium]
MLDDQVTGWDETRIAPRTNMFIAAVLHAAGGSCPVRIRNLSRSGALVEAAVLPPPGSAIALVRGAFRVTGTIVWNVGPRCGLRLDAAIIVADWMSNSANRHQGLIDKMVAEIKGGFASEPAPVPAAPPALLAVDLEGDIDRLRLLLEAVGDDLTGEPETLVRHATSLQNLDIAGQMLDALKGAVDSDSARSQGGYERLQSLRRSGDAVLRSAA